LAASPLYRPPARPPGLYRAARAFRRASAIALVLIIVFVAFVAYSAYQVAQSRPHVGTATTTLEPNDTVGLQTTLSLSDPSYLPIQQFSLSFRISNVSGGLLVASSVGPATVAAGTSTVLPVDIYFPVSAQQDSLLIHNQYLDWDVWGNATYGYLFSLSLGVQTQKTWGAPFNNLSITVGTPAMVGGVWTVPVTLSFTDSASFADIGSVNFQVLPPSGPSCASGSFTFNVPSGQPYDDTQNVGITAGCNPAGGTVDSQYIGSGIDVALPPESIP